MKMFLINNVSNMYFAISMFGLVFPKFKKILFQIIPPYFMALEIINQVKNYVEEMGSPSWLSSTQK